MKTILCPECMQGQVEMTGKGDTVVCDNCGCGFLQLDFSTVRYQPSDWLPCAKAHLQPGNAEYQQEMLHQSKRDEHERFMSHWGGG